MTDKNSQYRMESERKFIQNHFLTNAFYLSLYVVLWLINDFEIFLHLLALKLSLTEDFKIS